MFLPVDEDAAWAQVHLARGRLAAQLEQLPAADWDAASLCDGWQVRAVVAHLILIFHYQPIPALPALVRSRFDANRFLRQTAVNYARRPTGQLLDEFKAIGTERRRPAGISTLNALVDTLVHEQDIYLPLGVSEPMPEASLRLVFEHWRPSTFNLGERIANVHRLTRDLQFKIADLDITVGHGKTVQGPGQAVLLALAGRSIAVDGLSGDGVPLLRARMDR